MKFTKVFRGVPDGDIYPVEYQPGDICPPELVHAASEVDALSAAEQPGLQASKPVEPAIPAKTDIVPSPVPAAAMPAVRASTRKKR
jgi:hypothetical protein